MTKILCAIFLLLTMSAAHAQPPNGPPIGKSAPTFVLPDIQGQPFRLEDYKGRTLVLNFWAFWCDTWKAEMPSLEELASRQDELNFHLVAVSVDGTRLSEFARRTSGSGPRLGPRHRAGRGTPWSCASCGRSRRENNAPPGYKGLSSRESCPCPLTFPHSALSCPTWTTPCKTAKPPSDGVRTPTCATRSG